LYSSPNCRSNFAGGAEGERRLLARKAAVGAAKDSVAIKSGRSVQLCRTKVDLTCLPTK
jgi:hypothetical protein